jgi:hypothetical protein
MRTFAARKAVIGNAAQFAVGARIVARIAAGAKSENKKWLR